MSQSHSEHDPFWTGLPGSRTHAANEPLTLKSTRFPRKNEVIDRPRSDLNQGVGGSEAAKIDAPRAAGPVILHESREHGKYARFMPIARAFAAMSKLPGTKVGCLILGEAFQVLSSGWNGAPRGSTADVDKRSVEREERLKWVVHAEMNAIANAARAGTALNGATLLCTLMPCMTCAKSIVQAGIKRVICPAPGADSARWGEEFALATQLFEECDVEVIHSDTIGGQE